MRRGTKSRAAFVLISNVLGALESNLASLVPVFITFLNLVNFFREIIYIGDRFIHRRGWLRDRW